LFIGLIPSVISATVGVGGGGGLSFVGLSFLPTQREFTIRLLTASSFVFGFDVDYSASFVFF
jgi:hypothetical protein